MKGKIRLRSPRFIPPAIVLTDDEIADQWLFEQGLCYVCLLAVPDGDRVEWRLSFTHRLVLHRGCSRRVELAHHDALFRKPLKELLRLLRGMRAEVGR